MEQPYVAQGQQARCSERTRLLQGGKEGKAREMNCGKSARGSLACFDRLLHMQEMIRNGFATLFTGYPCLANSPVKLVYWR